MSARSAKHSFLIITSILLILSLFVTAWLRPSLGLPLGLIFLLFILAATGYTIARKYRQAYLQGEIPLSGATRNTVLEFAIILLAMLLAGLLGRYFAEIVTGQMAYSLVKIAAGIVIGLLVGFGIGTLAKRVWMRLAGASLERWIHNADSQQTAG